MDAFWSWFYEQLEKKPSQEETEALKNALEGTIEAPLGSEPLQSAKLLQSRIGNQAMQRLLEMKATAQQRGEPATPEEEPVRKTASAPNTKTAKVPAGPPAETPEAFLDADPTSQLEAERPASTPLKAFEKQIKPRTEATGKQRVAVALAEFMPTLKEGGDPARWRFLAAAFKEAPAPARETVLRSFTKLFPRLKPGAQRVFMERLQTWKKSSADELAALLWLRLSPLSHAAEIGNEGGANDGDDD